MIDPSQRRLNGGFRTVEPNLVGWLALLTPGALMGGVASLFTPFPVWIGAAAGASMAWYVALFLDQRKWLKSEIRYVVDVANLAQLDQITARLRTLGITSTGSKAINDDGEVEFQLAVTQRDRPMVERELNSVE